MTATPTRAPSATVDAEHESVLPAVPGTPWWGAVLICVVLTGAGVLIGHDKFTDGIPIVLWICFLAGCALAALAVRQRAVFTAMVQPPLVLALCLLLLGKFIKDLRFLDAGVNVAMSFPLMLTGTLVAVLIGIVRLLAARRSRASR